MKFIIGQKKQMTQVFRDDGTVVPVTVVRALPNVVTQVKSNDKDGYVAVQVGSGTKSAKNVAKAQKGQWKDKGVFRTVKEFRLEKTDGMEFGATVDVSTFQPGDEVLAIGTSKGRGYAGVVKRHHFKGGPASHGHKDNLRAPGSIGATFPQHVLKGTRMAGRMGNARVTVKGLEVVEVRPEQNELLISGAIPGPMNGIIAIQTV